MLVFAASLLVLVSARIRPCPTKYLINPGAKMHLARSAFREHSTAEQIARTASLQVSHPPRVVATFPTICIKDKKTSASRTTASNAGVFLSMFANAVHAISLVRSLLLCNKYRSRGNAMQLITSSLCCIFPLPKIADNASSATQHTSSELCINNFTKGLMAPDFTTASMLSLHMYINPQQPSFRTASSFDFISIAFRRHFGIAHVSINGVAWYRPREDDWWRYVGCPLREGCGAPTRVLRLSKRRRDSVSYQPRQTFFDPVKVFSVLAQVG